MLLSAILLLTLGLQSVEAVFYRKIPFRYKSAEEIALPAPKMEVTKSGIQQLLDQIDAESGEADEEETTPPLPLRRHVRLIPLRTREQREWEEQVLKNYGLQEEEETNSPSAAASSLPSHLVALRPDYAFKNVADFLRNFFDSRIERSRKRTTAAEFYEESESE